MSPFKSALSPRCAATFAIEEAHVACPACGGLLDVAYDWNRCRPPTSLDLFERKWGRRYDPLCYSGVWRFHELLPFARHEHVVTVGEGQTCCNHPPGLPNTSGCSPAGCFCSTKD